MLAALESVDDVFTMERILETPDPKREELRGRHGEGTAAHRTALVEYFLHTHPLVSWGKMGGVCLRCEEDAALQVVKRNITPDEGEGICIADICSEGGGHILGVY